MRRGAIVMVAMAGFLTLAAFTQADGNMGPAPQDVLLQSQAGTALSGYDPVAYFRKGKPVRGNALYTYRYNGLVWVFENKENRSTFAIDPAAYTPQFGGYSAYDVANGTLAGADPESWSIVDGRLYLHRDEASAYLWNGQRDRKISQAQTYWDSISR